MLDEEQGLEQLINFIKITEILSDRIKTHMTLTMKPARCLLSRENKLNRKVLWNLPAPMKILSCFYNFNY
ncbi:hypothetical protein CapIbe_012170 [Capra ibex]